MYAYTYRHYTPVLVDPRLGGGFPHKTSDLQHGGYGGTAQPAQPRNLTWNFASNTRRTMGSAWKNWWMAVDEISTYSIDVYTVSRNQLREPPVPTSYNSIHSISFYFDLAVITPSLAHESHGYASKKYKRNSDAVVISRMAPREIAWNCRWSYLPEHITSVTSH